MENVRLHFPIMSSSPLSVLLEFVGKALRCSTSSKQHRTHAHRTATANSASVHASVARVECCHFSHMPSASLTLCVVCVHSVDV